MFCTLVNFLTGIEIFMTNGGTCWWVDFCMCAWTHPHISGYPLEEIKGDRCLWGFLHVKANAEENVCPKTCSPEQPNVFSVKSGSIDCELKKKTYWNWALMVSRDAQIKRWERNSYFKKKKNHMWNISTNYQIWKLGCAPSFWCTSHPVMCNAVWPLALWPFATAAP